MTPSVRVNTKKVVRQKTTEIAGDLNPNSKPIGVRKPNAGFAKHYVFIADDLFDEDLKA